MAIAMRSFKMVLLKLNFFECPSTYTSRQMLISNVPKILVDENIFSHSEVSTLNSTDQNTSVCRAGLKPMQPMQLHWAPRHGV